MSWRSRQWPHAFKPGGDSGAPGLVARAGFEYGTYYEEWDAQEFEHATGNVGKLTLFAANTYNAKRGKPRWRFPVVGGYYANRDGYECRHQCMSLVVGRNAGAFDRGKNDRRLWGQYVGLAKWIQFAGCIGINTWLSPAEDIVWKSIHHPSLIRGNAATIWNNSRAWGYAEYAGQEINANDCRILGCVEQQRYE